MSEVLKEVSIEQLYDLKETIAYYQEQAKHCNN